MQAVHQNNPLPQGPLFPFWHTHAHQPARGASLDYIVTQAFFASLWLVSQPFVIFANALLFLVELGENKHPQLDAFKRELQEFVSSPQVESTQKLEEIIFKYRTLPGFPQEETETLLQLLCIVELRPHIRDILAGANVCFKLSKFVQNQVDLEKHFPIFRDGFYRPSSHNYVPGCSWGLNLRSKTIEHILTWISPEGHVHFQLEKTPLAFELSLSSLLKAIVHLGDMFKYRSIGQQLGPLGTSSNCESTPLVFHHSLLNYAAMRDECLRLFGACRV